MDGINQSAYIGGPMNRLLLTFLALLAGLLAQGAPAQARAIAAGTSQIGALEAPLAQSGAVAQVQVSGHLAARHEVQDASGLSGRLAPPAIHIPTVQIGIDRARE